jgi:hypothetical protein
MTREDHLKFCSVCVNRKIGAHHETICSLTNAKADFDPTCPSYQFDNDVYRGTSSSGGSGIGGGVILSIVLAVISVVRLASTCNNSSRNRVDDYSQSQFDKMMRERENERAREKRRDQIGELSDTERALMGIKKAQKDSLVVIDKFMNYTLLRNEYLMAGILDNQIVMMARDKKNFNYVIHKFDKSDDPVTYWQKLRKANSSAVTPSTINYKMTDDNTFTYKIKNSFSVTNGKARFYCSDKNCYVFQYESNDAQNEVMIDVGFDQVVMDHIQLKK